MQIGNVDYNCLCLRYVTSEDLTTLHVTSEYVTSRHVISEDVASSNLGLIVGLSVGLALLVIVIIIVVVLVVRRHKSKKDSRRRLATPTNAVYHYNEYYGNPELWLYHGNDVYSTIPDDVRSRPIVLWTCPNS